jgi:Tfp pilus assembly protein PilF
MINILTKLSGAALILACTSLIAADTTELIGRGEALMREGRLADALSTLEQAVAADPKSSLAYTRLGGAQLLHQDHASAIGSFRQAIMLDGKNADAFVGMAMAYLHGGDYALARAALEEAKRIDPAKQAKIDEVIAYINGREAGGGAH